MVVVETASKTSFAADREARLAPAPEAPLGGCIRRGTGVWGGGLNRSKVQDPSCPLVLHSCRNQTHGHGHNT